MKSLCIIVAFVAFIAFAKADTATLSPLDKAISNALETMETGFKKLELTGIKSEFNKTKVHDFLINNLGGSKIIIEEALKNLETNAKPLGENFKNNVDALSKQFADTVKTLNSSNNQESVKKFQESLQTSLKSFVEQVSNTAKSAGVTPSLEIVNNLQKLVETVNEDAKIVQEKIQQLITETQKKTS